METCEICNKSFKNLKAVFAHANKSHGLRSKEYYDKFLIKEGEGKCFVCVLETTYRDFTIGYLKNCSVECGHKNIETRQKRSENSKGRKQSKEHIEKRVNNTDQAKKEYNRKQTMIDKYGVDNPTKLNSVKKILSEKNKGRELPRTDEWQNNIIKAKRNNGTLKHSDETKNKIRNTLNKHYSENLDREKYISKSNNINHLSGWYNGLYFR